MATATVGRQAAAAAPGTRVSPSGRPV